MRNEDTSKMGSKWRPNALVIAGMVSVTTMVIAWILSIHHQINDTLFTVLITAGVIGLVNLARDIVSGPTVPADTHERMVKGESTPEE